MAAHTWNPKGANCTWLRSEELNLLLIEEESMGEEEDTTRDAANRKEDASHSPAASTPDKDSVVLLGQWIVPGFGKSPSLLLSKRRQPSKRVLVYR